MPISAPIARERRGNSLANRVVTVLVFERVWDPRQKLDTAVSVRLTRPLEGS